MFTDHKHTFSYSVTHLASLAQDTSLTVSYCIRYQQDVSKISAVYHLQTLLQVPPQVRLSSVYSIIELQWWPFERKTGGVCSR